MYNSTKFLENIRKELKKNIDIKYKKICSRFYKEEVKSFGVRTPIVRNLSKEYFKEIRNSDKKEIFSLCEKLLDSGYNEETIIAFDWSFRLKKDYQESDFKVFETWLKKYVSNWGDCDDLCTRTLGYFIFQHPEFVPYLKRWANSKNRWLRRASAVTLIYAIRHKKLLKEVFEIASILLLDKDDLVQKGYGWMLKEAGNHYQKEVFDFVIEHKKEMPRTALRYAIEKMPDSLRKIAMKRD